MKQRFHLIIETDDVAGVPGIIQVRQLLKRLLRSLRLRCVGIRAVQDTRDLDLPNFLEDAQ